MSYYYKPQKFRTGDWGFYTPLCKVYGCLSVKSAKQRAIEQELLDRRRAAAEQGLEADALRKYFQQVVEYLPTGTRP